MRRVERIGVVQKLALALLVDHAEQTHSQIIHGQEHRLGSGRNVSERRVGRHGLRNAA